MIGKSQGETEIPLDPSEWFPGRVDSQSSELSSITWQDQRSGSGGQTSICGNDAQKARSTKIELRLTAGLETDGRVYWEPEFPCTVPENARTGRWIADRSNI